MQYEIDDLKVTLALTTLDLLTANEIVQLSMKFIENDVDSDELAYLAGETKPILSDVKPLFENVLIQLTKRTFHPNEAICAVLRFYIELIIKEKISPVEGLSLIAVNLYQKFYWYDNDIKYNGDYLGIEKLLDLYYEYDVFAFYDDQDKKAEIAAEEKLMDLRVKIECQKLLNYWCKSTNGLFDSFPSGNTV